MKTQLKALVVGQALDGLTFLVLISMYPWAIAYERSPFTASWAMTLGPAAVPAVKLALSLLVAWAIGWSRWRVERPRRWFSILLALGVVSGFVGAAANLIFLIRVSS